MYDMWKLFCRVYNETTTCIGACCGFLKYNLKLSSNIVLIFYGGNSNIYNHMHISYKLMCI